MPHTYLTPVRLKCRYFRRIIHRKSLQRCVVVSVKLLAGAVEGGAGEGEGREKVERVRDVERRFIKYTRREREYFERKRSAKNSAATTTC